MTETSSHEPAALALENVGKRFGSVIALSDVSMSVPKRTTWKPSSSRIWRA